MRNFFKKSKNNAKSRLYNCITNDREKVREKTLEALQTDIENVFKKHGVLDGRITIEIKRTGNNVSHITAGAFIRGAGLY